MSNGWEFLQRLCPLCGYTMGKHVVPGVGSPLHNETTGLGMLCPTDARLEGPNADSPPDRTSQPTEAVK